MNLPRPIRIFLPVLLLSLGLSPSSHAADPEFKLHEKDTIAELPSGSAFVLRQYVNGSGPNGWVRTEMNLPEPADQAAEGEVVQEYSFQDGGKTKVTRKLSQAGNVLSGVETWDSNGADIQGHIRFEVGLKYDDEADVAVVFPDGEKTVRALADNNIEDFQLNRENVDTMTIRNYHGSDIQLTFSPDTRVAVTPTEHEKAIFIRIYFPPAGEPLNSGEFTWTMTVTPTAE